MPRAFKFSHRLVLAALIVYWCLIALGTHLPAEESDIDFISDKVMHFGAFGGLAFLLSCCVMRKTPSRRLAIWILAITLCYGAMDEITQRWIPSRSPELKDWLADCLGAVTGFMTYLAMLKIVWGRSLSRPEVWTSNSVPINEAA